MGNTVTPKVFLLGETQANMMGIRALLEHLGAPDWESDAYSDSELLTEVMGRSCYKSFGTELNPNITQVRKTNKSYLANTLKKGDGSIFEHCMTNWFFADVSRVFCYLPDTEILTGTGWKRIDSIADDELLLTKNPSSGTAWWSRNKKLHSFDYNGPIHWFESSQWRSPGITPDHIMWAVPYDLRKNRGLGNREIIRSAEKIPYDQLMGRRFVVDHSIRMQFHKDPRGLIGAYEYDATQLFKWLGLLATDGTIQRDKNGCSIIQYKERSQTIIEALMNDLFGTRWKRYGHEFRICDKALKDWAVSHIGRIGEERRLVPLFEYPSILIEKFLEGALLGDGNVHTSGHQVLYCGYEQLSKDYQVLLAMTGHSSNIRIDDRRGQERLVKGSLIKNKRISYVVSIHKKGESLVRKNHQKSAPYSGKVFCPETDDGLVFVRRDGMAFWAGNTHELVRHRVGVAISQESLRFVRLTDLDWYAPLAVRESEGAMEIYARTMEELSQIQRDLSEMFEMDEGDKDFALKKKLTSTFRRLAPLGLATNIGWSANFRTLRHVLEQRTAPWAEEEIRVVFQEVGLEAVKRWPNIFADYKTELADGLLWFKTDHPKV